MTLRGRIRLFIPCLAVFLVAWGLGRAQEPPKIDFSRYLNSDEILNIMKALEKTYPQLARVQVIGKSYLGKDLHLMEIFNPDTGPAMSKPAVYIDGNMHTGEQTGAMLTLYIINWLLANYGKDPQATRLVDTTTFYLRPKHEVDASDWWLAHPGDTDYGGSVRPRDNDLDGKFDEDPAEDLDGDGQVTKMRIKAPFGTWKISPKDPRAMVKRKENETTGTFYDLLTEGIDNDLDGKFNEDGLGGVNLSHNYSWGNLNREQMLSSPYTLSEPETQATVKFWTDHPNIFQAVDLHTSGSLHELLYFPGGPEMPASDLDLYKRLAAAYAQFSGRENVLDLMTDFPQPIWRLGMGDPEPFMYYNLGVLGWCEEMWGDDYANPALHPYDSDKDRTISPEEFLQFLDKEAGGKWFAPWKPYNHPQLGPVEIGGVVEKYCAQNPPPNLLERELKLKMPWYLYLAELAPRVKIKSAAVTPLDGRAVMVKATIENRGYLATNVTDWAAKVGLAKPVLVTIDPRESVLLDGPAEVRLGHIPGRGTAAEEGLYSETTRTVSWILKKTGDTAAVTIAVISEKGGRDEKILKLD
jgi:hypothetical protein